MLAIRVAQQNDKQAWIQLYKKYLKFYKTSLSNEQLLTLWGWFFNESQKIHCHVASLEDNIVGLVHFREFLRPIKASVGIFMDDLFVEPSYRGRGIAQKLILSVEHFATQQNISVVRWITAADNHGAMKVYAKLATKTQWITYDMVIS